MIKVFELNWIELNWIELNWTNWIVIALKTNMANRNIFVLLSRKEHFPVKQWLRFETYRSEVSPECHYRVVSSLPILMQGYGCACGRSWQLMHANRVQSEWRHLLPESFWPMFDEDRSNLMRSSDPPFLNVLAASRYTVNRFAPAVRR